MDVLTTPSAIISDMTTPQTAPTMNDGEDLKERIVILEKFLSDPTSDCYIERLLDVVVAAVNDFRRAQKNKENTHIMAFCERFLNAAAQLQSFRRQPTDFTYISLIGHGAFGRVQLVREITTGRVCAMKIMKKSRLLTQQTDYWAEREIMSRGESPWIVQLYYAFQDMNCLYMVMEYVPGGNLVGWMQEVDMISEPACRFYVAETVLALLDLHEMGFIHRDLKPDNLLFDGGGHVKLADFGTAIRVDPHTKVIHTDVAVGTPDYLSPEVLLSQGSGGGEYGFEVDWWALGIVVYELLYGDTPFYSESLVNTYSKIMSHSNHLHFPDTVDVSDGALDFMKSLLCSRESRLGVGPSGWKNVLNHYWFSSAWAEEQKLSASLDPNDLYLLDWSWATIRACRAPFQPHLSSETDTSYFQVDTDEEDTTAVVPSDGGISIRSCEQDSRVFDSMDKVLKKILGAQMAFAGFSFSSPHPDSVSLLNGLQSNPSPIPTDCGDPGQLVNGDSSTNPPLLALSIKSTASYNADKATAADRPTKVDVCVETIADVNHSGSHHLEHDLVKELDRLQSELDETKVHSSRMVQLERDLAASIQQREALECTLAERDYTYKLALEDVENTLQSVRSEAKTELAHMQSDVVKWKSIALAVQDATKPVMITTEHKSSNFGVKSVQTESTDSTTSFSPTSGLVLSSSSSNSVSKPISEQHLYTATDDALHSRVKQLSQRVDQAESVARESVDQLETEQRFHNVYKAISEEKSEQIKELHHALEEMQQYLDASQTNYRRQYEAYLAAHRAFSEEQQRCARYAKNVKEAEKRASSASRRATMARRDADNLRNEIEELKRTCAIKQKHCDVVVEKINEVLRDPASAHAMFAAQKKDGASALNLQKMWDSMFNERYRSRINSQAKEIKRLQTDIKRLNRALADSKRETQTLHTALLSLNDLRDDPQSYFYGRDSSHNTTITTNTLPHLNGLQPNPPSQPPITSTNSPYLSYYNFGHNGDYSAFEHTDTITDQQSSSQILNNRHSMIRQLMAAGEDADSRTIIDGEISGTRDADSHPATPQQLPIGDFNISDFLELGTKLPNRTKRLAWVRHYVQLTDTHFIISGCSAPSPRVPPLTTSSFATLPRYGWASSSNTSTATRTSFVPTPPSSTDTVIREALHQIPLGLLYYVRRNDSSEMLQERTGVSEYTFTVAYSILSDSVHKPKSPFDFSQATTLLRKASTGSNSIFSTHQSPSVKRTPIDPSPATLRSSHGNLNFIDPNTTSSTGSSSPLSPLPSVLLIRGHRLQPMQYTFFTSCDWCHKSSLRPTLYQCVNCQFKLHTDHLTSGNCMFADCSKVISSFLFRCTTKEARELWISHISAAIQYAQSKTNGNVNRPTTSQSSAILARSSSVNEPNKIDPIISPINHVHANSLDASATLIPQKPPQSHRSTSNSRSSLHSSTPVDDRRRQKRFASPDELPASSSPEPSITINDSYFQTCDRGDRNTRGGRSKQKSFSKKR